MPTSLQVLTANPSLEQAYNKLADPALSLKQRRRGRNGFE